MKTKYLVIAALLAVCVPTFATPAPAAAAENIVVIAHPTVPLDSISSAKLKSIYLGRQTHWSNGRGVSPIMRPASTSAGKLFFRQILQMLPARYRHHWDKLELSGKGMAPSRIARIEDVASFVSSKSGSISYVLASKLPEIENSKWTFKKITLIR